MTETLRRVDASRDDSYVRRRAAAISERTLLPLGMVAAVVFAVATGSAYVGSKVTSNDTKLDSITSAVGRMESRQQALDDAIRGLLSQREFEQFKERVEAALKAGLTREDFDVWILLANRTYADRPLPQRPR